MYQLVDFEMDEAMGWEGFNQIVIDDEFSLSVPIENQGIFSPSRTNQAKHWYLL